MLWVAATQFSGVAKGGPGRARTQPKHHVRPAHVTRSRAKRARALVLLDSLELAYNRCPANTNDLAMPLTQLLLSMVDTISLACRSCGVHKQ